MASLTGSHTECGVSRDAMGGVAGLLVCCAWYYTILCGFYVLYCPVLYLMFINQNLYRKVSDTLFSIWELYPVALFQCCCKTKIHHYGDYVDRDENTIVIMNHRTRVDWNYVWMGLYHATQDEDGKILDAKKKESNKNENSIGGRAKIKFVLKDELKSVPGLGWIMQMNFFLYVKRNWQQDQLNLAQFVDYYQRVGSGYRLVLFPEGTDHNKENRRRSDRFAVVNSLPHLEYLLHPRTTGFAVLCSKLRTSLRSVYDVSVAYDRPAQTEADLFAGTLPRNVYFHFKRYSIDELPCEEDALRGWLNNKWREKELSLKSFHEHGHFLEGTSSESPLQRKSRSLTTAKSGFVFWTLVDLLFTYAIISSVFFQFWVIYHSLLFVFVTWKFGGFQNIQYLLLDKS